MIQKKLSLILFSALLVLGLSFSNHLSADTTNNPELLISQIKVTTDSQFVSLYNNTNQAIDMTTVSLQYFNNYQLSGVTSIKNIQLSGSLPAHSFYIINDGPINVCYQSILQSASLSFSTKVGLVQIVKLSQQTGNIGLAVQDYVSWSSTKVAEAQTLPTDQGFLQRQQASGKPLANGSWQAVKPSTANPCDLVTSIEPNTPITNSSKLLPASPAPATIVSVEATEQPKPTPNAGLKAPQLTELLPNPISPKSDSKDEFIEIYNSNNSSFDLSGFKLQTASSPSGTRHNYTFPSGTNIKSKSFAAYPSSNISISLTNTSGVVWLIDPSGKTISQTEAYAVAKEGQAWAWAAGKWYWTSTPTPNAANVIKASSQSAKATGSGVGTVQGISTTTPNSTTGLNASQTNKPRSLNTTILVAIGALAVIYGIYEYRRDLANAVQKFQRNRATRRENRPKS